MKFKPLIIFLLFNSLLFSQSLINESNYYQSRALTLRDTTSFEKVNFRRSHSVFNIAQQIVIGGAGMVIPSSLLFGTAFVSALGGGDRTITTILALLSVPAYLFGTAGAVDWVASHENPNNSFWETFKYTSIGFGVGLGIVGVLSTKYTTIPGVGGTIAYVSPLIAALVYANFIADWPAPEVGVGKSALKISTNKSNGNLTFYEYRNADMIFNFDIMRVRF